MAYLPALQNYSRQRTKFLDKRKQKLLKIINGTNYEEEKELDIDIKECDQWLLITEIFGLANAMMQEALLNKNVVALHKYWLLIQKVFDRLKTASANKYLMQKTKNYWIYQKELTI